MLNRVKLTSFLVQSCENRSAKFFNEVYVWRACLTIQICNLYLCKILPSKTSAVEWCPILLVILINKMLKSVLKHAEVRYRVDFTVYENQKALLFENAPKIRELRNFPKRKFWAISLISSDFA